MPNALGETVRRFFEAENFAQGPRQYKNRLKLHFDVFQIVCMLSFIAGRDTIQTGHDELY